MPGKILVVDDEPNIGRSIALILGGEGIAVTTASSGEAALAKLGREKVDAIFLDVNLPGIDGLQVLRTLREQGDDVPVIMISGHATIERAVEATRLGALDFVEKPFSRDRVLLLARNALEFQRLRRENSRLKQDPLAAILGESPAVARLRETIAEVGPTDVRVLILGESGTGKELVARALHDLSPRAGGPFVKLNCAAIPDDLIEAELFGAVKGAYTGAVAAREGRFAAADGGTLLLDEVGDMSLAAQAKVLRVLQEGEFEPVGSMTPQKVDVRVIAATHQDLRQSAQEGRFREDLLYRLNVIPIEMPPLRGRPGDVALLMDHFLRQHAARHGLTAPRLDAGAAARLAAHAWPGNVRELMNLAERLVILRHGREVCATDLPVEMHDAAVAAGDGALAYAHLPLRDAKLALEADLVRLALERHGGNVTRAAEDLGLERTHLHKRIRALGLALATACLLLAGAGGAAARSLPERPAPGEKPDFHVVLGGGWLSLDTTDSDRWGLIAGVGWTWADRLRLQAELGGWPLDADAGFARVAAVALVPVAGGLSGLGSLGAVGLQFDDDEALEGFEAGVGAAYTAHLAGPFSLEGRYTYLVQRYFEDEIGGVTVHLDDDGHLLGLLLILDL